MRALALFPCAAAVAFDSLKAHIYDHCPYCTRVELVLGWHGLPYERVVYGYADVQGPTALTGKKLLPVITFDEAGEKVMGESVEIIKDRGKMLEKRRQEHAKTLKKLQEELLNQMQFSIPFHFIVELRSVSLPRLATGEQPSSKSCVEKTTPCRHACVSRYAEQRSARVAAA